MTREDYIKLIRKSVAENHCISEEDLLSIKRNSEIVDARDIYIYLLHKYLSFNLTKLSKEVKKTIPSISLSLERIQHKIKNDKSVRFTIDVCEKSLKDFMNL